MFCPWITSNFQRYKYNLKLSSFRKNIYTETAPDPEADPDPDPDPEFLGAVALGSHGVYFRLE